MNIDAYLANYNNSFITTKTDKEGKFYFTGVAADTYIVAIRATRYVYADSIDAAYPRTFFPNVTVQNEAQSIDVAKGKLNTDINISLALKYPEELIKGRVFFENSRPAPKVFVSYVVRTPEMKTKSILTIILAFIFLFIGIQSANACSCSISYLPCGGVDKSKVIFLGEATNVSVSKAGKKAQFNVIEPLNNVKTKTLTVYTGFGGGDCGYPFKKGEKYLVYGNSSEGKLYASICSRTRSLSKAQDDLEILRQLKLKKDAPSRLFGYISIVNREKDYKRTFLIGVKLKAIDENGKFYETVTDRFGNYRFVNLPDGKYQLLATYNDMLTKKEEIIIDGEKGQKC